MDVERPLDRHQTVTLDIGKFVAARETAGHTQSSLARAGGVAQSTVNHIERGVKNPSVATAKKLARVLDVSLDDIKATPEAAS